MNHLLTLTSRTVVAGLALLIFLAGYPDRTFAADFSQSTADTIFGRLSQRFQLGSTEELLVYKRPVGPYFATIRGEVLLGRPAYLDVVITEQESGERRSDLSVLLELCGIADETVNNVRSCINFDGPRYEYAFEANWRENAYRADGFMWDTDGTWEGKLIITDVATGNTESVGIMPFVYPPRPASSNLFEIVSLILPFVALGLFLIGLRVVRGRFSLQQA